MSYVILKKPYLPGDELTSWEPVQFVGTFTDAVKIVKQHKHKFKFNRGDLVVILVAKHVSAIEAHADWLWIAIDSTRLKRCPQRSEEIEGSDFNWIELYEQTTEYGVFMFLDDRKFISRGYVVAASYELLSLLDGHAIVNHYKPLIKLWIDGEITTQEIGVIKDELQSTNDMSFPAQAVLSCLLGISMTNMNAVSNLGITMTKINQPLEARQILHEMIPLQEFLLIITEKRKLKLAWE